MCDQRTPARSAPLSTAKPSFFVSERAAVRDEELHPTITDAQCGSMDRQKSHSYVVHHLCQQDSRPAARLSGTTSHPTCNLYLRTLQSPALPPGCCWHMGSWMRFVPTAKSRWVDTGTAPRRATPNFQASGTLGKRSALGVLGLPGQCTSYPIGCRNNPISAQDACTRLCTY